jgi:fluoride exporter
VHTADDDSSADLSVDPDVPGEVARAARAGVTRVLRERWDILLVIAAGGALGSLGRWAVSEAVPHAADGVAWGTWLENVSGAFLLGLLMVLVLDYWPPHRYVRPFLAVGVLGGYTTFSTYMLDTRGLLAAGRAAAAFGYLAGTLLSGLAAVWVGVVVARGAVASREGRRRSRNGEQTGPRTGRQRSRRRAR